MDNVKLSLTPDEARALEDVVSYWEMAAGPDGSYYGGNPTEEEAETWLLVGRISNRLSELVRTL